jgi:hypothetical protein
MQCYEVAWYKVQIASSSSRVSRETADVGDCRVSRETFDVGDCRRGR